MGQENPVTPQTHKDANRAPVTFSVLITCILFLLELYEMINDPGNLIALGVIAVLMLAAVCMMVVSIMKESQKEMQRREEQYDTIFKSEKASYLILRKSFDELQTRLDKLEKELKLPADEIVTAQKAIAKVTISRSKENTDALMNSNDKLMERVLAFEEQLDHNNELLVGKQKEVMENANKDVFIKQQEILSTIKEMELNIRNQVLEAIQNIPVPQPQIVMPASAPAAAKEIADEEDEAAILGAAAFEGAAFNEVSVEEPVLGEMQLDEISLDEVELEETPVTEEVLEEAVLEETAIAEETLEDTVLDEIGLNEVELEETPIAEEILEEPGMEASELGLDDLTMEDPVLDEIALEEVLAEEEPVLEETPVEEEVPVVEETPVEEAPIAEEASVEEEVPVVEEAPAEEVEIPEVPKPSEPAMNEANKVMSPDDIAALIANTTASASPEIEKPVIPEKMPELDLSDPNKAMSPDEIAALIASI